MNLNVKLNIINIFNIYIIRYELIWFLIKWWKFKYKLLKMNWFNYEVKSGIFLGWIGCICVVVELDW